MAGSRSKAALGLSALATGLLPVASADAGQVLIDVGSSGNQTTTDTVGRTWTNVTNVNDVSGSPFTLLSAAGGGDTGYRMTVTNPPGVTNAVGFNSNNDNGTTAPTGTALARGYPSSATADSLFGNSIVFSGATVQAVRLILSNLNPAEQYSLDFFASRTAVTDNRDTEFRIMGGPAGTADTSVFLNASNNTGTVVGAAGFRPDANGQITVDIDAGPNNTNTANGFFYLGVMEINSSPVPEPAGLGVLAAAAAAGLLRRRRTR